jgi:hypothetical protein
MADPTVVVKCIRILWSAQRPGAQIDEETESSMLAAWGPALAGYSDEVVKRATQEWIATSLYLPKPSEFVEVARRLSEKAFDRRALGEGMSPRAEAVLGKAGSEGLATGIVWRRMFREVAKVTPKGYVGRWAGLSSDTHPGAGVEEAGHKITPEGHDPDCERCWLLASVAYEQAIKFPGSSLTAESWVADSPEGLRSCRNTACDHGWVTVATMEGGRVVERQHKCPTCDGPKAPRAKVEAKAEGGEVKVPRSRSKGRWHR